MRNRLIFILLVALLGIPALPAAADDVPPSPAPSESATPTEGNDAPLETPPAESEAPTSREAPSESPQTESSTPSPQQRPRTVPQQRASTTVTISALTAGRTGADWNANVWGTAAGAPLATVWTEVRLPDGTWSRSQVGQTSDTGYYALPLTYGRGSGGTYTFRTGVETDSGTVYSTPYNLTRISISASTAGATSIGVGANVWGTAVGAPNTAIWTEVRLANGNWSRSQVGTTSASGYYVLPLTYGQHSAGTQTFRVGVQTDVGPFYSQQFGLARVAISASTAVTAPVNTNANIWGTAQGAPSAEVWTEVRLANGSWSRSQTARTSTSGYYSIPLTYGQASAGAYTFRVAVRVNGTTLYSPQRTLTRVAASNLDPRCLSGRVMCASKKDRKMHWVINGQIQKTFDARFGCPGTPSDNGSFRVFWKSYNHTSTIYGTWMPRAMFYNGGEAVHFSQDFQARGWAGCSGGCINIRDWNGINDLYNEVRNGDKVVVY